MGNFGTKNVLPIMRNHYHLAALLHDVFRKPHRQKVHLHLHKKVYSGADDMNLSDICAPKAPVSQKGGSDSKPL